MGANSIKVVCGTKSHDYRVNCSLHQPFWWYWCLLNVLVTF